MYIFLEGNFLDISQARELHKICPVFNVIEIGVTVQHHKDLRMKHDLTR